VLGFPCLWQTYRVVRVARNPTVHHGSRRSFRTLKLFFILSGQEKGTANRLSNDVAHHLEHAVLQVCLLRLGIIVSRGYYSYIKPQEFRGWLFYSSCVAANPFVPPSLLRRLFGKLNLQEIAIH
jgi:hypothetical protein